MKKPPSENIIDLKQPIPGDDGNLYFTLFSSGKWRCLNTINDQVKKADAHIKRKLKNKGTL